MTNFQRNRVNDIFLFFRKENVLFKKLRQFGDGYHAPRGLVSMDTITLTRLSRKSSFKLSHFRGNA